MIVTLNDILDDDICRGFILALFLRCLNVDFEKVAININSWVFDGCLIQSEIGDLFFLQLSFLLILTFIDTNVKRDI